MFIKLWKPGGKKILGEFSEISAIDGKKFQMKCYALIAPWNILKFSPSTAKFQLLKLEIKNYCEAWRICTLSKFESAGIRRRFSLRRGSFSFSRRPHIRQRAIVFHPMSATSDPAKLAGPADDFLSERHVRDDDDRGKTGAILYRRIPADDVCIIAGCPMSNVPMLRSTRHKHVPLKRDAFMPSFADRRKILLFTTDTLHGKKLVHALLWDFS